MNRNRRNIQLSFGLRQALFVCILLVSSSVSSQNTKTKVQWYEVSGTLVSGKDHISIKTNHLDQQEGTTSSLEIRETKHEEDKENRKSVVQRSTKKLGTYLNFGESIPSHYWLGGSIGNAVAALPTQLQTFVLQPTHTITIPEEAIFSGKLDYSYESWIPDSSYFYTIGLRGPPIA